MQPECLHVNLSNLFFHAQSTSMVTAGLRQAKETWDFLNLKSSVTSYEFQSPKNLVTSQEFLNLKSLVTSHELQRVKQLHPPLFGKNVDLYILPALDMKTTWLRQNQPNVLALHLIAHRSTVVHVSFCSWIKWITMKSQIYCILS